MCSHILNIFVGELSLVHYVLSSFITRGSSVGWRPRRKGWMAVHIPRAS